MDPNPYQAPRAEPASGKPRRLTLTIALLIVLAVVVGYIVALGDM